MPRVFYTGQTRSSPPADREWSSDGSGSEAETDVESGTGVGHSEIVDRGSTRPKAVHRRTDTMDNAAQQLSAPPKRPKRAGNAVIRQRQTSRELRDATGQRPLQKACSRGDTNRVIALLANNPDLQDRDYAGTTALHTAALQGDERIVEALLDAGAVPDVRSGPEELDTPLMDAAANGFLSIVKRLLASGADPRVTNATGRIALDFVDEDDEESEAITKALNDRTRELRIEGATLISSPTQKNAPEGLFPPGFAGIQRPAAPMFLDVTKRSTRHEIVEHAAMGDLEYVGLALERGWRPSADALIKAAKYGHSEVVGLLLAFGLDSNINLNGTSPLREAIDRAHYATVKLLLDSGASMKPEYKKLVSDLPAWDQLRALVLGEEVKTKPVETSISQPKPTDGKTSEVKIEQKKPQTPRPEKDGKSEPHRSKEESGTKVPDVKPNFSKESSIEPESRTSSPAEFKLSKYDLKSIKPKKRSKSVADNHQATSNIGSVPVNERAPTAPPSIKPPSAEPIAAEYDESNPPDLSSVESKNMEGGLSEKTELQQPKEAVLDEASKESTKEDDKTNRPSSDIPESKVPEDESSESNISQPNTIDAQSDSASLPSSGDLKSRATSPAPDTTSRQSSVTRDTTRESPYSGVPWVERSQELNELAERKAKERRDREARMLESLAQEQRRRSDTQSQLETKQDEQLMRSQTSASSPLLAPSPREGGDVQSKEPSPFVDHPDSSPANRMNSPFSGSAESPQPKPDEHIEKMQQPQHASPQPGEQDEVSVKQLPWVLRNLAYTGEPQQVAPLLVHSISGAQYYIDLQVALAIGDPQMHKNHPQLAKTLITPHQKQMLWSFCRPWICRPGSSSDEVKEDARKFLNLTLCWVHVKEIDNTDFAQLSVKPSTVAIQLEPNYSISKSRNLNLPLRWQSRTNIASRAW